MLLIIRLKVSVRSLLTAELLRAGRYESSERVGRGCCPVQYRSERDCGIHIHSSTEREKKTWRLPNVQQTICGSEVSVILQLHKPFYIELSVTQVQFPEFISKLKQSPVQKPLQLQQFERILMGKVVAAYQLCMCTLPLLHASLLASAFRPLVFKSHLISRSAGCVYFTREKHIFPSLTSVLNVR